MVPLGYLCLLQSLEEFDGERVAMKILDYFVEAGESRMVQLGKWKERNSFGFGVHLGLEDKV